MNAFLPILLLAVVVVVRIQALDISISTQEDYELDQGNTSATCRYAETETLLKFCTNVTEDPGNATGFWSSCEHGFCVLPFVIGKIGDLSRVPSSMRIRSYVQGKDAVIRIMYRHYAIPEYDVRNTSGWEMSRSFDLSCIQDLTLDSEIRVQLQSTIHILPDIDVIDEIIFTFPDNELTSTEVQVVSRATTAVESSTKNGSPALTTSTTELSGCPKLNSFIFPLIFTSIVSAKLIMLKM